LESSNWPKSSERKIGSLSAWRLRLERWGPWALLVAFLAWGWGPALSQLGRSVPAYADVLELTWATSWFSEALSQGRNPLFYPLAFYPQGWHVATFAAGPAVLLFMLPLHALGGAAFAHNVAAILTFFIAFAGMRRLARHFLPAWPAAVAALLYAFCSFRWFALRGHMNMLLATAMLPWLAWALESGWRSQRRAWRWWMAAGVFWAVAVSSSLYFLWIGGLIVLAWALGGHAPNAARSRRLCALVAPIGAAALFSAPAVYLFWDASRAAQAAPFTFKSASYWGASLNSLVIPYVNHPVLGPFACSIYHGPLTEQGALNLGLLACALALVGWWTARSARAWRPFLLLVPLGMILALGLTLKWDNEPLQWPALRPLNALIWRLGYALKPVFFGQSQPPAPHDAAIPLPGLLLATLIPYLEQSRVFARYALLATLGIAPLAARVVAGARKRWLGALLAGLLLFEVVPPQVQTLPFPPPTHPAFAWLQGKAEAGSAIADVAAWDDSRLVLYVRGEAVWATLLHGHPTVAGASSVWPAQAAAFNDWLFAHPHPFQDADFVSMLRSYGVRYLVFHMLGSGEQAILADAAENEAVRVVGRFEPPAGVSPWNYPITIVEILANESD